ncbi:MAG: hypothetical protein KIY12_09215 [Thermoplasmata archaeon]|uniref:Uncharacterized protein n=1 Tax=Candidatus Sysuiplasma superficiale TaxID=2823368 RepID=A0A8J7YQV0_9ARCH|nr:hypothetical protein [Candidatus Sysuiplasma superficiale]MBX8644879.1 hypothetical protein [Candidatus Sysuiplasma superficiale]MCL4347332.1 hypothetical protein [Candidatus Thermoplasmatota archaeon]
MNRYRLNAEIIAGIFFLIIASPLFVFYNIFPTINSQVGPHQLSSWISILLGFLGFMFLIYGLSREDM